LNDQAAMPRGYVIDQNPEIYFSDNVVPRISSVDGARVISNNGYLICIDKMEKRPDFKEKRKKMELYLEKKSSELKKMSSSDKKRKLALMWDESETKTIK
jgi:hypothetical protein